METGNQTGNRKAVGHRVHRVHVGTSSLGSEGYNVRRIEGFVVNGSRSSSSFSEIPPGLTPSASDWASHPAGSV